MNSAIVNKKTTKCKIIECAKSLFCKHGIDGTSIREIASEADVNLAAINYHFKSKENLYKEIFNEEYRNLSNSIDQMFIKSDNLEQLSSYTFLLFIKNAQSILFLFHSFLNLEIDAAQFYDKDIKAIGPIGAQSFFKQLNLDLKGRAETISAEKKIWLVRTLLGSIIHSVISLQSPLLKKIGSKVTSLNIKNQERSIKDTSKALFNFL